MKEEYLKAGEYLKVMTVSAHDNDGKIDSDMLQRLHKLLYADNRNKSCRDLSEGLSLLQGSSDALQTYRQHTICPLDGNFFAVLRQDVSFFDNTEGSAGDLTSSINEDTVGSSPSFLVLLASSVAQLLID